MKDAIESQRVVMDVANLSPRDALFIRGIVALFTDDSYAVLLAQLQRGEVVLEYSIDGCLTVQPTQPALKKFACKINDLSTLFQNSMN